MTTGSVATCICIHVVQTGCFSVLMAEIDLCTVVCIQLHVRWNDSLGLPLL